VQIYENYGIEATRLALIKEIKDVIETGGNACNIQHIELVVDVIVNTGILTAINRHGINKLDTDPFSRASFEKTVEQFILAAAFNEKDHMRSVSARIMAGKPFRGGTGLCDLIMNADMLIGAQETMNIAQEPTNQGIVDFTGDNFSKEFNN